MKVCFMCDLHLPFIRDAIQFDVLDWAVNDIKKKKPACIIFAGDATADGNETIYDYFLDKMISTDIPFLYIAGNSDLRDEKTKESIFHKTSPSLNIIKGIKIFAVNDSNQSVSENQIKTLDVADSESIVFMHHPFVGIRESDRRSLIKWRESHCDTMLFFGHMHFFCLKKNDVSLPAMDPDKAIGGPSIVYYDTDTRELINSYYPCPVPKDLSENFGVSCYNPQRDIIFAIENGLKNLELRPNVLTENEDEIKDLIAKWRKIGGTNLSIHLSEVSFKDGKVSVGGDYEKLIELAIKLKAERFTQHVPKVSVATVNSDETVIDKIAEFIAERLNAVPYILTVGVENMHMTESDMPIEERRFGYIPEEVLAFMTAVGKKCKHKVGINFDIGHARNNVPYSKKYQIGTWLAMLGKYIVGYHLHQVKDNGETFENHTAIDDVYGKLISFASFFRCWADNKINHAPVVFEMRTENAYEITLNAFKKETEREKDND